MCTTAAKKINGSWFLIKTRDPVTWMRWDDQIKLYKSQNPNPKQEGYILDKYDKWIVQNPDPHEDGYYGGINDQGVSIVATFVKVHEDQISYLRKPYIRLILNATDAQEAVRIIQSFYPYIGGNIFVADKDKCFGIEASPKGYFVEEIKDYGVKTNHFQHTEFSDLEMRTNSDYRKWSESHYERALELIEDAQNVDDLKNILKDRKNCEDGNAICTTSAEDECFTHSAFVFDNGSKVAHYVQGNPVENEFKEYKFK